MDKQIISLVKSNHAYERQDIVKRQLKKPIGQLIDDFIIEMDA